MSGLVKTTAAIGTTEVLLMGVAMARNKYLAMTIGPEGFGIYGILNSFFMMVAVFAGSWIATGTTKYIAEYQAEANKQNTNVIFSFAVAVSLLMGLLLTAMLILCRGWFLDNFLTKDVKESYYLLFAAAFITITLRPVLLAVLQGQKRVREVVISRWGIATIDLILVIVLVLMFGLTGFFISLLVSAIWAAGILLWATLRKEGVQFIRPSWHDPVIRLLLSFGVISLILSLFNLGSQYIQRIIIVQNLDIQSVGLFQAGVAFMFYLGVVGRGSKFYYFPKMSEKMDNDTRNEEINEYLRLVIILGISLSVPAILLGEWVILLLYSSAFVALSSVFYWFVLGQFISSVGSALKLTLVGMARLKMHAYSSIVVHSLWVIIPLLLVREYGIGSVGMGFVGGGIIGSLMEYYYLRRHIGLKFSPNVIHLFGVAVVALGGAVFLKDSAWMWRVGWSIISIGYIGTKFSREEWSKGYNYVLIRLGMRNNS
ncbi:Lipid III flippase [subsurface metagenome]